MNWWTMWQYRNYPFMIKVDFRLWWSYLLINPYRASRKYLQNKGEKNPYQYGETPLCVIDALVTSAGGLQKYQLFADLGAGRGRITAFIQEKYRCKAFAFEQMAMFVKKGKKLFPKVDFIEGNFLEKDLSKMDLIYLYGTMMSKRDILAFVAKVPKNARVITVSYPLTDYDSRFKVLSQQKITFPWGETKGYIQCLRK